MNNEERLQEIISVVDSQKESIRKMSVNDARWLIKQVQKVKVLESKVKGLEDSLRLYKEENDNYEQSTHIDNFMYDMNVNEEGEISFLIKANGVEHSLGITERDAKSFVRIFQMNKMM